MFRKKIKASKVSLPKPQSLIKVEEYSKKPPYIESSSSQPKNIASPIPEYLNDEVDTPSLSDFTQSLESYEGSLNPLNSDNIKEASGKEKPYIVSSKRKKPSKTPSKSKRRRKQSGKAFLKKRGSANPLLSGESELSGAGFPGWALMDPGKKAAALKTYIDVYAEQSLARKLRCIHESAQTAMNNLETDFISAHGNATFLELGFKEDSVLRKCDQRHRNAFFSLLKTLDKLRDDVIPNLMKFVQHDVMLFWSLEDELSGFVRELGNQSEDVVRANPPPQPERMINLSIFNRHPNTRNSGGKKRFSNGGSSGSHVTGSASSTRRTAAGGISSNTSLGTGVSGQGRTTAGNRGKKTTGLRPVMHEFVDYACRLSS